MSKFVSLILLFIVLSCSEPQRYVHKAISIMDKNGLYAEGEKWDSAKEAALKSDPETMDEAYSVVLEALKIAGGKHSFLYPANRVAEDNRRDWEMPSVSILDNKIASVKLPSFHGNKEEGLKYSNTVIEGVPDEISGIIIDLRGNVGGDMYPMIAAVHRFIPDGNDMLRFKTRKRTSFIPRSFVLNAVGVTEKQFLDCPVAILTDSLTASSGEATLLCFRGLQNVMTFGCPTAGYASSNCPYSMPDGSSLVLTTGCDVARTNEVFCDEPIAPNMSTITPEADAVNWLLTFNNCLTQSPSSLRTDNLEN